MFLRWCYELANGMLCVYWQIVPPVNSGVTAVNVSQYVQYVKESATVSMGATKPTVVSIVYVMCHVTE